MRKNLTAFLVGLGAVGMMGTAAAQQRGKDGAPAEGAKIPRVSAKTPDGKKTVELYKPERFTVLVFGSYT